MKSVIITLWRVCVLLLCATYAEAATCAATSAAQFTSCLTTVSCGDTITLTAGSTFVGEFVYAKTCGFNSVTITSDSSAGNFPSAGYRVSAAHAAFMPSLHSTWDAPHANSPAIYMAEGASGLYISHLRGCPSYRDSNGSIFDVGDYYATARSGQPDNVTFDQIIVDGDCAQDFYAHAHRAFGIHGTNVTIKNSYINHITSSVANDASSGEADSVAIFTCNTEGPLTVTNNWINGATYHFIACGGDINRKTIATITGSITTTSAAISWSSGDAPWVGVPISIADSTNTPCWAWVTAYTASTATTGTVTWDTDTTTAGNQGCANTPVSPGDVRWGVNPGNLTWTYNRDENDSDIVTGSIVPMPTGFSASSSGSGSLGAGTYTVYLIAEGVGQQGTTLRSKYTAGQSVTVGASGRIALSWTGDSNASGYKAYVQAPGGTWSYTSFGSGTTSGALTAAGTSASGLPTYHRQRLKNFFETKVMNGATVQYNIFRYHSSLDVGYAMWFKNASQNCNEPYQVVRNITVSDNRFEHINGALLTVGTDYANSICIPHDPRPMDGFTYTNNVVWDSSATWDGYGNNAWAISESNGPRNVTIQHNTIDHSVGGGSLSLVNTQTAFHCRNYVVKDNVLWLASYGIRSQSGNYAAQTDATAALNAECDSYTVTSNAFAYDVMTYGGYATATFPSGNSFPTPSSFTANFNNYAAGTLTLVGGSSWINAGSDGKNLGADQTAFLSRQSAVENGTPYSSGHPPSRRLRLRR